MKKIIWPSLMILIILIACKKDETPSGTLSTKASQLTNGTWKITAVVSDDDGNGSYETDDFATFFPCYADNYFVFKTNSQLEMNEGATKCDPADPQTESGTWSLTDNEANIMINTDKYAVVELTNTTFRWREDGPGNTSSIITLTKR